MVIFDVTPLQIHAGAAPGARGGTGRQCEEGDGARGAATVSERGRPARVGSDADATHNLRLPALFAHGGRRCAEPAPCHRRGLACLRRMLAGEEVTQESSGMSKGEWREFEGVLK